MAGEFDPAIAKLVEEINADEATLSEKKRMVNRLCGYAERPPIYSVTDTSATQTVGSIRQDQFFGQPLATAIRMYLEMRRASQIGAASAREIFDALKTGGFVFDTKNDDNALRGLRQSLTKNSVTFTRLPNGAYGLAEWYPNVKPPRAKYEPDIEELLGDETKSAGGAKSPADPAS